MKKYFVPATKVVRVNVNAICEDQLISANPSSTPEAPLF
jgi:hypothetical protein